MTDEKLREIAIQVIYNYYNGFYSKEKINTDFSLAVELLVENSRYRVSGASYVGENGIAITYANNYDKFALTNDVLALLPKKRNYKAW